MVPAREVEEFEERYEQLRSAREGFDPHRLLEEAEEPAEQPARALAGIGLLRRWLDEVEDEAVFYARDDGMPWSRIGALLGLTRQAVWARHRDDER